MSHDDDVKDTDPTGRYIRFDDELGRGAYKVVYRAIDRDRGIEVAWNQIRVDQAADFEKLWKEITILQSLSHPNILVCHSAWVDEKQLHVVFITECMTSGTIRQFMKKAKTVKLKVLKGWCSQILAGLNYLHTRDPPIIHRDIKCDNILINGTSGVVKIGDLGLATNILNFTGTKLSVIGTPEFMAPEYYDEVYDIKVDIWAFGMCLLEMATLEYPFSECTNPAQIFKKVSSGGKPRALLKLKDLDILQFLSECLAPAVQRKSAAELLQHPFLQNIDDDNRTIDLRSDEEIEALIKSGASLNGFPTLAGSPSGIASPSIISPNSSHTILPPHEIPIINSTPTVTTTNEDVNQVPQVSAPITIPTRKDVTNHMEYTTSLTAPVTASTVVSATSSSFADSDHSADSPHMSLNVVAEGITSGGVSLQGPILIHSPGETKVIPQQINTTANPGQQQQPITSSQQPSIDPRIQSEPGSLHNSSNGHSRPHAPMTMPASQASNHPHHSQHSQHLQSSNNTAATASSTSSAAIVDASLAAQQASSIPTVVIQSNQLNYVSSISPLRLGTSQGDMTITAVKTPQSSSDPYIVSLRLSFGAGGLVEFDFRIDSDTAAEVAKEMSQELGLSETLLPSVAKYINDVVAEFIAHQHPEFGIVRNPHAYSTLITQLVSEAIQSDPNSSHTNSLSVSPRIATSPRRFVTNVALDKHAMQIANAQVSNPAQYHPALFGTGQQVPNHTQLRQSTDLGGILNHRQAPIQPPKGTRHSVPLNPLDNELETFDDPILLSPRSQAMRAKRSQSSAVTADEMNLASPRYNNLNLLGINPESSSPTDSNLKVTPSPRQLAAMGITKSTGQPFLTNSELTDWASIGTAPLSRAARHRSVSAAPYRKASENELMLQHVAGMKPTGIGVSGEHHHPALMAHSPSGPHLIGSHHVHSHDYRPASTQIDPQSLHASFLQMHPFVQDAKSHMEQTALNFDLALRQFESNAAQFNETLHLLSPDENPNVPPEDSDVMDDEEDDEEELGDLRHEEEIIDPVQAISPPNSGLRSSPIGIVPPRYTNSAPSSPIVSASIDQVVATPFGDVVMPATSVPFGSSSPARGGLAIPQGSISYSADQ